jgi:RecB family exonuclease
MTKAKMLDLPKVYEVNENTPEQYKKYEGMPKLSYSAYNSFCEEAYKGEFFANYFLGIRSEGNIFTEYGSKCGEYLEKLEESDLSNFDISVLEKLERPENARYEVEVVIDRGSYVIQGFIDQEYKVADGLVIKDLKTGAIDKKAKDYASEDYQQTTLYAYQRELEGENVVYSGVMLLDRKGNGQEKYPLRLTGEIADIPTPYSKERAEAFLKKFDKVAMQIEEYHKVYKKYFA